MNAPGDADDLVRRDHGRLLWNLALAGAQVRRAEQVAGEWRPERLDLGAAPRALLVATDEPTAVLADLVGVLAVGRAPVAHLDSPQLPPWAGAADAVLVVSLDGRHPRLVGLADQAARRGCSLAVIAPTGSPVAVAAGRGVVVDLPADTARRAALWSGLGPTLLALGAWRLTTLPPTLFPDLATALDEVSHRCRPSSDAVANPARALAEQFAESQPLVVGAGPLAACAARAVGHALRLFAGAPALASALPADLAEVTGLLTADAGGDDFFRDRTEDLAPRPRLLLIGNEIPPGEADPAAPLAAPPPRTPDPVSEQEAFVAARTVERAAQATGVTVSAVDVPPGDALVRWAAAVHVGLFTAAYLALAGDTDPSAPRPGEIA